MDEQRDCDVIEDILRIYGYNNVEIPTTLKSCLTTKGEYDKSNKLQNLVAEQLVGCGFNEILNNSLTRCLLYTSYPFIKLIDNPKKIVPVAMNIGIRASKGDVVMRLDAHASYPTNYFGAVSYTHLLEEGWIT